MILLRFITSLVLLTALFSCKNNHLIESTTYRKVVEQDYMARSANYGSVRSDLFTVADTLTDPCRSEALKFMLAYMPLNDLAGYSPGFLMANIDAALKTRYVINAGEDIPSDIFLHFVLPQRVNNENLDSFRILIQDELIQRISGLEPEEAALEINHWCHEKVSYQPSDIRTSAPLATILSARGRCGEESTLTVSAMRAAGIPARQVYTPRWAHSDDNHAWVEVWVNGKWHYLGACEPEPVLNKGWFTEPARRAMLVHTKAFGKYFGKEAVVRNETLFSEINTLASYAGTKELIVSVVDEKGLPANDATVGFLLYNYAELYPLVSLHCDRNGTAKLMTGKGSLIVWARSDDKYGFEHVEPMVTKTVITLSSDHPEKKISLDLVAPEIKTPYPPIPEELVKQNNERLKQEDKIREEYKDSWSKSIDTFSLPGITGDEKEKINTLLKKSMGNYRNIMFFLVKSSGNIPAAIDLLQSISAKDLRDTPWNVLYDHLINISSDTYSYDREFYRMFILSPRVDNEILSPFRGVLRKIASEEGFTSPQEIRQWIGTAISLNDTDNYYMTPLTPVEVNRLRMADAHSRDIFFVALCRAAGFPSRLEPETGRAQYFSDNMWTDISFDATEKLPVVKSFVSFTSADNNPLPAYHIHFTLGRFANGRFEPLDFGYNVRINDLPDSVPLDPGKYMLLTGNRDETGNVLAEMQFFELYPDSIQNVNVALRHKEITAGEELRINLEKEVILTDGRKITLSDMAENGIIILWIDPDKEPTKHILKDIPLLKNDFNEWAGYFVFMLNPATLTDSFREGDLTNLPDNTLFALDSDFTLLDEYLPEVGENRQIPVILFSSKDGIVRFKSEGYRIGIGEQLLKTSKQHQ